MDVIVIILTIVAVSLVMVILQYKKEKVAKISFKETFDLTSLPIITFIHNNTKLNFILDTGANSSLINKEVCELCEGNIKDTNNTILGIAGASSNSQIIELSLEYKDKIFYEKFQICDLSTSFRALKESTGANVHGIIGTSFLEKYKYVIDFEKYIAYSNKKI